MALQKTIKELIEFYVKINYEKYLEENKITTIEEKGIRQVIDKLYDGTKRKEHIKKFVLNGIHKLSENGGHCDLTRINTLLEEILYDSEICKNRVYIEIITYQRSKKP
jgi:hypothetical protein